MQGNWQSFVFKSGKSLGQRKLIFCREKHFGITLFWLNLLSLAKQWVIKVDICLIIIVISLRGNNSAID